MTHQRISDNDVSDCESDVPSFIEARPPLIMNPFMRPKPQKGTNLMDLFEKDSESDEPELVQVYLRLKPCNAPSNLYEVKSDHCLITSLDTSTVGHGRRTQYNVSKMYTFSHIFGPEANQMELFERVVKDNLKKLPEGHSFTLLTYGASGSGKTFTLMGTVSSPGLVPRSLEYVFRVVDAALRPVYKPADNGAEKLSYASQEHELQFVKQLRQVSAPLRERYRRMSTKLHSDFAASNLDLANRIKYYVWVSFVEIYNEGIYDLLSNNDRSSASKLVIREDSNGNVYVKGATQVFVKTGEEAYDVMVAGKHNLQVAATGVNARSSRSHCIFTITMLTETEAGCRVSSVRLCDLAGCERARRTRNAGARLAESRAINTSLHVLERCLRTLRQRQRQRARTDALPPLPPYRESKLTRLLGAGLSGARGEAVSVVVTVNPAAECALETRHVLQLAAVAKDIQVNNTVSEYSALEASSQDTMLSQSSSASSSELQRLRAENERLHFELLQAQEYSKELTMSMEEQRARNATNMKAIFSEGQDITRQHYETLMRAVRQEVF
ncbi:Kinesin-like protein subito [Papilio machaon]|uniref:Kinesin-like protein subito n=1 Tax=Papilio machaon TaxID=76193 RepID=A0A194RF27_PAPMA|nr:Kinesin-like protein subito [Papilio machaon]